MPVIFIQPDDSTIGQTNTDPGEATPVETSEEDTDAEGQP
jgi:hypothetical protein